MHNSPSFPVVTPDDVLEFCHAARRGDDAAIRAYADKYGSAILDAKDSSGETALILALLSGRESTMLLLIEKGASLDIKDSIGRTVLDWAKLYGSRPTIALLEGAAESRERQKQQEKQKEKEKQDWEHAASAAAEQNLKKLKHSRPAKPALKKDSPK